MTEVVSNKKIIALRNLMSQADWIQETDTPAMHLFFKEIELRDELMHQADEFLAQGDLKKYTEFVRLRNAATKIIISLLREFGFTPRARKEIQALITKKDAGENELDGLMKGI